MKMWSQLLNKVFCGVLACSVGVAVAEPV